MPKACPTGAATRVLAGGRILDRKGVNLPDTVVTLPALTEKDRVDLEFGLSLGVDWVGLSFVQWPEDLAEAKGLIQGCAGLIAKIEKPSALDCLHGILAALLVGYEPACKIAPVAG
ncbi:pyruvate kinase [Paracoccus siganidrum]|uniref:pyruvate kinase n=1 Tax=Paracoccus siganidrum TaxID=1276757 RepID=A0A419AAZ5_9RHOB|nr:pyruvate kinase [Paracoccus siganidrum]RJL20435.1 hypothetical protein D3P05_03225 [Paracoccus siganidrum]RMC39226.1 hypothetical protein C9E82_04305 [Paracoccus siganidrum]